MTIQSFTGRKGIFLGLLFFLITAMLLYFLVVSKYGPFANKAPLRPEDQGIFDNNRNSHEYKWTLPGDLENLVTPKLTVNAPYSLWVQEPDVVREVMQTRYSYPVFVMKGETEVAEISVEFCHVDTGDIVYYLRAKPFVELITTDGKGVQSILGDAQLVWTIDEVNSDGGFDNPLYYIQYDDKIDNAKSNWKQFTIDSDKTVLPLASIYTEKLRFGLVDIFTPIENHVFVENIVLSPFNKIHVSDHYRQWMATIPLYIKDGKALFAEQWGVISNTQLIDFEADDIVTLEQYTGILPHEQESIVVKDIRIADLDRYRKLRHDGVYYEVPESYVPYQPRAFWRVPAEHIGQRFIHSMEENEQVAKKLQGSYMETIAIISMNHSLAQQEEEGYWLTLPKSNWLYSDYGLKAGFYDTRFSTDAAMFLLDMYQYYKRHVDERQSTVRVDTLELQEVFEKVTIYADFILWYAEHYSFPTENGGLLIQDYFHPKEPHRPTHVSLNHLVTEMNFLLLYVQALRDNGKENNGNMSSENTYLNVAQRIRQAVHDTEMDWVKENFDLWYAYMPDGKYDLLDYPRLTRNDLRHSLELMNKVWNEDDQIFRKLIFFKEKYLQENAIPLW